MVDERIWNPQNALEWAWIKSNLKKPYGLTIEPVESYGANYPKLVVLTLEQVITRIQKAIHLGPMQSRTIPNAINEWMHQLNIASVHCLSDATKRLPRDLKLTILSDWFNGGNGLPRNPKRETVRLNLTHPALLNEFLNWVRDYLCLHNTIDGRINTDNEQLINAARATAFPDPLPPVRRF